MFFVHILQLIIIYVQDERRTDRRTKVMEVLCTWITERFSELMYTKSFSAQRQSLIIIF